LQEESDKEMKKKRRKRRRRKRRRRGGGGGGKTWGNALRKAFAKGELRATLITLRSGLARTKLGTSNLSKMGIHEQEGGMMMREEEMKGRMR